MIIEKAAEIFCRKKYMSALICGFIAVGALPPFYVIPCLFVAFSGIVFLINRLDSKRQAAGAGFLFGRLPVHVRCLIDEAANIGQIPNLEKLMATIRSREISACLVLQARSQLKAIYKDNADTIVGNMDSQIFLGGSEPTTLKDLSEMLGKETIDAFNTSDTRGNSPSYGTTFQKMGHELLSRDELAVLDGGKCILQLRGVRPFLSDKYDLTQHPNYKLTSDYDPKNALDIEKFVNRKEKIHPGDEFIVVDADSLPSA